MARSNILLFWSQIDSQTSLRGGGGGGGGGQLGHFSLGPSLKGAPIKGLLNTCLKDRYTLIEQSQYSSQRSSVASL